MPELPYRVVVANQVRAAFVEPHDADSCAQLYSIRFAEARVTGPDMERLYEVGRRISSNPTPPEALSA